MTKRIIFVVVFAVWIFIMVGCTSSASNKPVSVESQITNGKPIYEQTCATSVCHGAQGEGIRSANGFKAWPLVGIEFQLRHPNAQVIFDVIRSGSESNLLALTNQQIYDAIAYELNQNKVTLDSPLTADNAFETYGGKMAGEGQGGLFPPPDNVTLTASPPIRDLPISAQNKVLHLQLDQIAQASSIGNSQGTFLVLVIAFDDLDDKPITVNPDYLYLSTPSGELLRPRSIDIHSAIEKFHVQTIKPQLGTVGLVVFKLFESNGFDQLMYDDGMRDRVLITLKP